MKKQREEGIGMPLKYTRIKCEVCGNKRDCVKTFLSKKRVWCCDPCYVKAVDKMIAGKKKK